MNSSCPRYFNCVKQSSAAKLEKRMKMNCEAVCCSERNMKGVCSILLPKTPTCALARGVRRVRFRLGEF